MSSSQPFTLHIFVADGDPDGLRIVERSNWTGKALVFPRALLPKVKQLVGWGERSDAQHDQHNRCAHVGVPDVTPTYKWM